MRKYDILPISNSLNPVISALFFLLVSLIGFIVIGPLVGTMVVAAFFEGDLMDMVNLLQDPFDNPEFKVSMYTLQGFATGLGLILVPWMYIRFATKKTLGYLSPVKEISAPTILAVILAVFAFMVVNSLFIEWNSSLDLPESMSGLEDWMRQTEEQAARLTKYMTTFDSTGQLLLALLVIAVLPAIGEELVFRGFIQTELTAGLRNPHVAIWISAIIFSAIHMQFFGFVPRMLLGALFGYLYYWSGNMTYPILAHFVNNASQILLLYMVQKGVTDIDVDSPESFPVYAIILFSFITFGLLFYFKKSLRPG